MCKDAQSHAALPTAGSEAATAADASTGSPDATIPDTACTPPAVDASSKKSVADVRPDIAAQLGRGVQEVHDSDLHRADTVASPALDEPETVVHAPTRSEGLAATGRTHGSHNATAHGLAGVLDQYGQECGTLLYTNSFDAYRVGKC